MPTDVARTPLRIRVTDDVLRGDSLPPMACPTGPQALHLDLAAVEIATAAGLGKLVALHLELRDAGVDLVLLNVREELGHLFEATGLAKVFDVRSEGA